MADPRVDAYAQWLVANKDKAGTPEFETVSKAYKDIRASTNPINEQQYNQAWGANLAGMGLGIGDELMAGIGSISDIGTLYKDRGTSYDDRLSQIRESQNKLHEYDPAGSIISNVAGGIPLAVATGGPATSLVKAAIPAAGRLGQAAGVGALYGGAAGFGSGEGGLQNRLASAAGGAVTGAAFGTAVEGLVSPIVSRFAQYLKGTPAMFDPNTGKITPQGMKFVAEYAQKNGISLNELTDGLQRELAAQAGAAGAARALNPKQAMAMAEANSLPVKGPMTQGQLSQDPELQLFESEASKGRYGQAARSPIESTYAQIQDALRGNADAIRSQIAGTTTATEPGMRGQAVQDALTVLKDKAHGDVTDLYAAARSGGDAGIDPSAYRQGVQNVIMDVSKDFHPETTPKVTAVLSALSKSAETDGAASQLVSKVFLVRRQLTSLQGEMGAEGAAAGTAKKALDKHLVETMDEAALSGDKEAISRWKDAIKAYREYATKFEGDDLVQTLTEKSNFGSRLKVDPVDAMNTIFGRDDIGFISRGGMTRDLVKLRDTLGASSSAWKAIKEESFLRFLRKAEGAMRQDQRQFSGANFAKAWEDAQRESPHILRVLFTDEERNLIGQFTRYAKRVTISHPGGVNTSNSGGAIALFLKKFLGSQLVGPKVVAFLEGTPVLKSLTQIPDAYRAAGATSPTVGSTAIPLQSGVAPYTIPIAAEQGGRRR